MKRILTYTLILFISIASVYSKTVKPTKNIIVMIPDGTSMSVLSASRWLKTYRNEGTQLNIDPYLCGSVTTFCSNAPIGDSAPTTSCYMTGIPQQAGNVAIYPVADAANDLVKLNPDSAYQPLATLLEAMKIEQKKATGLVVTCEFPHATPADCSSHTYNRGNYKIIAPQMAANNLDVMFGGGNDFVSEQMKQHFKLNGTSLIQNNKTQFMQHSGSKVWALFDKEDMPNDLDRDTMNVPSIQQMTSKAIELLNKNKNGFFLMVEGSKIDWAAHANDPVALMSEYLAFDKAVGAALEFARKDGNTTVIVLPDHGNSGFSIGRKDLKNYTRTSLDKLFGSVSKVKYTAIGCEKILKTTPADQLKSKFMEITGIELTDAELNELSHASSNKAADYTESAESENLTNLIIRIFNSRSYFGFTSNGHTGEEVFLAAYHPKGQTPKGNVRNTEINAYLQKVSGLKKSLKQLTSEIYAKHTDVFKGLELTIDKKNLDFPVLTIKNNGNTLTIPAYSSVILLNGKSIQLSSVIVYVDKTNTFYLPSSLSKYML